MLEKFKQKYPGVELSMGIANEERIERLVLDRSLDFGFVGHESSRTEMISEQLSEDELVPVCNTRHRFARKSKIKLSDLSNEGFIVREVDSTARHMADNMLSELDLHENISMELGSYEAIKHTVMAGKGIGIVAKQSLEAEIQAGIVIAKSSITNPSE